MIYRRGKVYWYNFRWSIKKADGTVESFRIRQSAKTHKRKDAEDAENEHRRALRLGEIHPNDPWPKPAASAPPVFRAFAKEFLQYAKTHTKPGTHTFYSVCLEQAVDVRCYRRCPAGRDYRRNSEPVRSAQARGAGEFRCDRERRSAHVAAGSAPCRGVGQVGPRARHSRIAASPKAGTAW